MNLAVSHRWTYDNTGDTSIYLRSPCCAELEEFAILPPLKAKDILKAGKGHTIECLKLGQVVRVTPKEKEKDIENKTSANQDHSQS